MFATGCPEWFSIACKLEDDLGCDICLWFADDIHYSQASRRWPNKAIKYLDFVNYLQAIPLPNNTLIDSDFVQSTEFYCVKDKCLKLMDRLDKFHESTRLDREALFYRSLIWCYFWIRKYNPDVLLVAEAPHSFFQFLLYSLFLFYKKKVLRFNQFVHSPLLYLRDMNTGENVLCPPGLQGYTLKQEFIELLINKLQPVSSHASESPYVNPTLDSVWRYLFKSRLRRLFGQIRAELIYDLRNILRIQLHQGYDPYNPSQLCAFSRIRKKRRIQNNLVSSIKSLPQDFVLPSKYVYFALHFEPERTTCPDGGLYDDQFKALSILRDLVPNDVSIVVKEHPSQLLYLDRAYLGRSQLTYSNILAVPNLVIAPLNFSTLQLIDNSEIVSTITGSVGLEAALRHKATLIFGESWYSGISNVFQYRPNISWSTLVNTNTKPSSSVLSDLANKASKYAIIGYQNNNTQFRLKSHVSSPGEFTQVCVESAVKLIESAIL